MTATAPNLTTTLLNRSVNALLAIKPLWGLVKGRARAMMVKRAETIGVPWRERVNELKSRQSDQPFHPDWDPELQAVTNPALAYPPYYTTSFHAYDEGNLGWTPAMEVEVAAQAVHARLWPNAGAQGDARLRQGYHDVLTAHLPTPPQTIVDLGCGVGMSTETLARTFPGAEVMGVDLSPYFLAVARYRHQQGNSALPLRWHHAAAEETGLPAASVDLVSVCLVFHELPQDAARAVLAEARRLLKPGGHLGIMDMDPQSEAFRKMPPFVFTLLKSTEPYLDEYMGLDLAEAFVEAGFERPTVAAATPRHRAVVARVA